MSSDEKWAAVPPTTTAPWGITIRRADGSYREPTIEEIEGLLRSRNATSADHQKLRELAEARGPHAGSGCKCNECLRAEAFPALLDEIEGWRKAFDISEDNARRNAESLAKLDDILDKNEELRSSCAVLSEHFVDVEQQLAAANAEIERLRKPWTVGCVVAAHDVLEKQLVAMTDARDEACDIVSRMLALAVRHPDDFSGVFARIESLRKVGEP